MAFICLFPLVVAMYFIRDEWLPGLRTKALDIEQWIKAKYWEVLPKGCLHDMFFDNDGNVIVCM
jgi:hypothetical protein